MNKQFKLLAVALLLMVSPLLQACAQQSTVQQEPVAQHQSNGKHKRKPSAESFAACNGLPAGSICSFTTSHGTITGACKSPRNDGTTLFCAPAGGKKGGHRHAH